MPIASTPPAHFLVVANLVTKEVVLNVNVSTQICARLSYLYTNTSTETCMFPIVRISFFFFFFFKPVLRLVL